MWLQESAAGVVILLGEDGMLARQPASTADLARFVRETLGCGCPDDVLARIEVKEAPGLAHVAEVRGVLEVGGRLLVWILCPADTGGFRARLPSIVEAGRTERDARRFNRLRLVVSTPAGRHGWDAELATIAAKTGDDRVHVHLLEASLVPNLWGTGPAS